MKRKDTGKIKGLALVSALIITFLTFALVGAFLSLVTSARSINERYHENLIALGLAEAGADYAIREFNFGENDFTAAEGWEGVNPKSITLYDFQDADENVYGDISITVNNPGSSAIAIAAMGTISSASGPDIVRTVRVMAREKRLFEYAVLTSDSITLSGNGEIDSYDSLLGPYGGSNVGSEGDIVTNGTGNPAISLSGANAAVNGDANTGSGGGISDPHNGITGETSDTANEELHSVEVPAELQTLDSSGNLNASTTLASGNYKYDSIGLAGNKTVTLMGNLDMYITGGISTSGSSQIIMAPGSDVDIYFDGDVNLSGQGIWNQGEDPSALTLYGTGSVSNINLSGNSDFSGAIYAPSADVSLTGNGDIFGAVVSETMTMSGNGSVHFDVNLKESSPVIGTVIYAWQEK